MSDQLRFKLRETGQAPASRDRVGGRDAGQAQGTALPQMPWTVLPGCELCWVHFTFGVPDCSCACIADMLELLEEDGS